MPGYTGLSVRYGESQGKAPGKLNELRSKLNSVKGVM